MSVKSKHPPKQKRTNSLIWLFEPVMDEPSFTQRKMFCCEMAYLHGRQTLVLADQEEPWNGLLICTSREHHNSLQKQFPELHPHAVLGKWLYISQSHAGFESVSSALVELARRGDERLGIEPKKKRRVRVKSPRE